MDATDAGGKLSQPMTIGAWATIFGFTRRPMKTVLEELTAADQACRFGAKYRVRKDCIPGREYTRPATVKEWARRWRSCWELAAAHLRKLEAAGDARQINKRWMVRRDRA